MAKHHTSCSHMFNNTKLEHARKWHGIPMFKASQKKGKLNTDGQVMIVKLAYCVTK